MRRVAAPIQHVEKTHQEFIIEEGGFRSHCRFLILAGQLDTGLTYCSYLLKLISYPVTAVAIFWRGFVCISPYIIGISNHNPFPIQMQTYYFA